MATTGFSSSAQTYILSYAISIVGITLGGPTISGAYLHISRPNSDSIDYPNKHMGITCSSGIDAYDNSYKGFANIIYSDGTKQTLSCPSIAYNSGQIITFPNDETKPVSIFSTGTTTVNISPIK